MPTPTSIYTDEDGAVFVQASPGKQPYYIGPCLDAADLPNPKGDVTPIWCLNEYRQYVQIGSAKTAPSNITTTLTSVMEKTANWLERFAEDFCPFVLHYTQSKCGSKGVMGNWERVFSIMVDAVTDDVISNLAMREGGNPTTRAFSITARAGRVDSRELTIGRQTTTEAEALNDIWACDKRCVGPCGDEIGLGDHLQAAADAVAAGTANVQTTTNGGSTWAAAATDPFAADENIMAGVCFPADKDTIRWLVVRDGDAAALLEVAYSDDSGATWTNVTVGSTNDEAGTGPQCLFALDSEHIWLVTDDGNVFFSSDGGLTWTDQGASSASGGNALQAIHFVNAFIGYAVGASDTVITTENGGDTWTAATATGGGNTLNTVQVFESGQRVIVGDNGGDVYVSFDGTTTWSALPAGRFAGAGVGEVQCMHFSTDLTGLMVADNATPVGTVYHTVDGGWSWNALTTPDNDGLNSVIMLSPTLGYAVGEVEAGSSTAVILEITG